MMLDNKMIDFDKSVVGQTKSLYSESKASLKHKSENSENIEKDNDEKGSQFSGVLVIDDDGVQQEYEQKYAKQQFDQDVSKIQREYE